MTHSRTKLLFIIIAILGLICLPLAFAAGRASNDVHLEQIPGSVPEAETLITRIVIGSQLVFLVMARYAVEIFTPSPNSTNESTTAFFSGNYIFSIVLIFIIIVREVKRSSERTSTKISREPELDLPALAEKLNKYFNLPELEQLCFDLGIDIDDLRGETKARKAQELVGYCKRRGRIEELIARASLHRPHVQWP